MPIKVRIIILFFISGIIILGLTGCIKDTKENQEKLSNMSLKYLKKKYNEDFNIQNVHIGIGENDIDCKIQVVPSNNRDLVFTVKYPNPWFFNWSGGFEDNYDTEFVKRELESSLKSQVIELFGNKAVVKVNVSNINKGRYLKVKDYSTYSQFAKEYANDYKKEIEISIPLILTENNLSWFSEKVYQYLSTVRQIDKNLDVGFGLYKEGLDTIHRNPYSINNNYFTLAIDLPMGQEMSSADSVEELIKSKYPFLMSFKVVEMCDSQEDLDPYSIFDGKFSNDRMTFYSAWSIQIGKIQNQDFWVKIKLDNPKIISKMTVYSKLYAVKTVQVEFTNGVRKKITLDNKAGKQEYVFSEPVRTQDIKVEFIDFYTNEIKKDGPKYVVIEEVLFN